LLLQSKHHGQNESPVRSRNYFTATPRPYEGFKILGVEHEAAALGKNLDQLFQLIVDRVRKSQMSADLRDFVARHLKSVRYYDKTVYVFEVEGQADPSSYADLFYVRHGAQLTEVPPSEIASFIRRFDRGQ